MALPASSTPLTNRAILHWLFRWGIWLKAFDGAVEIFAGAVLLLARQDALQRFVAFLTRSELIEDPHDFVANELLRSFHYFPISTQHFSGFYLLAHGVIKVALAFGLLRELLWVFPTALTFLAGLLVYQIYRITLTHSLALVLLTMLDAVILILVWREYRRVKMTVKDSPELS